MHIPLAPPQHSWICQGSWMDICVSRDQHTLCPVSFLSASVVVWFVHCQTHWSSPVQIYSTTVSELSVFLLPIIKMAITPLYVRINQTWNLWYMISQFFFSLNIWKADAWEKRQILCQLLCQTYNFKVWNKKELLMCPSVSRLQSLSRVIQDDFCEARIEACVDDILYVMILAVPRTALFWTEI